MPDGLEIQRLRGDVERLECELDAARLELRLELLTAQQSGATIAQLQDWSGYSRRQVMNLLAAARGK